jgi:hypothetical protein
LLADLRSSPPEVVSQWPIHSTLGSMQVISHFLLSNFPCLWVGMGERISSMLLHVIKTLVGRGYGCGWRDSSLQND